MRQVPRGESPPRGFCFRLASYPADKSLVTLIGALEATIIPSGNVATRGFFVEP
jgi:hypothetical protein